MKSYLKNLSYLVVIASVFAFSKGSGASGLKIPYPEVKRNKRILKDIQVPAGDLTIIKSGKTIQLDRDEALELIRSGEDISLLNPLESDFWQDSEVTTPPPSYPSSSEVLEFEQKLPSIDEMFRADVTGASSTSNSKQAQHFNLILSLYSQPAMLRAKLLRKLGYPVTVPKYYKSLKIKFKNKRTLENTLLSISALTSKHIDRWVKSQNNLTVELKDVILESSRVDIPQFHWGAMNQSFLQGRRSLRALILPLVLSDIPESINVFSWEAARVLDRHVLINHPYGSEFQETTFEDARWILRKLAKLTEADFAEILSDIPYPDSLKTLIIEKLKSRRNGLLKLFRLDSEFTDLKYDPKINAGSAVKNGKLVECDFEGYGTRFCFGDPDSPLEFGDILRFLKIEMISTGVGKLLEKISSALPALKVDDIFKDYSSDLQKEAFEDLLSQVQNGGPIKPFVVPVKTFHGPTAGVNVNASRNIISGTFYGVDSKMQLVDSMSARASVGYFLGVGGIDKILPTAHGNVFVQRNYIHVRPVPSIKAGDKKSWADLLVPRFMNKLSEILKTDKNSQMIFEKLSALLRDKNLENDEWLENELNSLNKKLLSKNLSEQAAIISALLTDIKVKEIQNKILLQNTFLSLEELTLQNSSSEITSFLDEMKENETFMVFDSLGAQGGMGANISLSDLLSASIGMPASVGIDISARFVLVKRTIFRKTSDGIQVYVQRIKENAKTFQVNANWFVELFRHSRSSEKAKAHNKMFEIRMNEPTSYEKLRFAIAVKSVLKKNKTEILEHLYPPLKLDHNLAGKLNKTKFLFWRWASLEEKHRVTLTPPEDRDPDLPGEDPRWNPEEHKKTLFKHRIIKRSGKNPYAQASDLLNMLHDGLGPINANSSGNPSGSFMGKSKWITINTEAEITDGVEFSPVTRLERAWSGWKIKKDKLFNILSDLNTKFTTLSPNGDVIELNEVKDSEELQFYEVKENIIIYEEGLQKLFMDHFYQNEQWKIINALANFQGVEKYQKSCKSHTKENGGYLKQSHSIVEKDTVYCALPWMKKVLKIASSELKSRKGVSASDEKEAQIIKMNRILFEVLKNVHESSLLRFVNRDHYFFWVTLNGFRKGDENGDKVYVSGSIGDFNDKKGSGIFAKYIDKYRILGYELLAGWFSEGF